MIDKSNRIIIAMIWLNFFMAIFFGLEIAMKSYAFGLRRAFSQVDWVLKIEFFNQPVTWSIFFYFISGKSDNTY